MDDTMLKKLTMLKVPVVPLNNPVDYGAWHLAFRRLVKGYNMGDALMFTLPKDRVKAFRMRAATTRIKLEADPLAQPQLAEEATSALQSVMPALALSQPHPAQDIFPRDEEEEIREQKEKSKKDKKGNKNTATPAKPTQPATTLPTPAQSTRTAPGITLPAAPSTTSTGLSTMSTPASTMFSSTPSQIGPTPLRAMDLTDEPLDIEPESDTQRILLTSMGITGTMNDFFAATTIFVNMRTGLNDGEGIILPPRNMGMDGILP